MSKIQIPQKIREEDFSEEDRELASKIGGVYNQFSDEVYRVLSKGIDIENLKQQRSTLTVQIGSTGLLATQYQIKSNLSEKIVGVRVLNAVNLDNPSTYPTSWPGVSFAINGSIINILNITGLQNNSTYSLLLELIV